MQNDKHEPRPDKPGSDLAGLWRVFLKLATFTNFLAETLDVLEKSGLIS